MTVPASRPADEHTQAAAELLPDSVPGYYRGPATRAIAAALAAAEERGRDETARKVLGVFEDLFSGGPDTSCRTSWIPDPSMPDCSAASIECVEVPMADLRAAFDAARDALDPQ